MIKSLIVLLVFGALVQCCIFLPKEGLKEGKKRAESRLEQNKKEVQIQAQLLKFSKDQRLEMEETLVDQLTNIEHLKIGTIDQKKFLDQSKKELQSLKQALKGCRGEN